MATEIPLPEFIAAHRNGAFVVDVREPGEYAEAHVPGAVLAPLGQLPTMTDQLPGDRRIYVVCASGRRSLSGTDVLVAAGLDAVSVAGGTQGWINQGRPVDTGSPA